MIKKLLFACLCTGSLFAVNAQKNTVLVAGSVGISSTKAPNVDAVSQWNFDPTVGYQFNDNWTAGITASIGGTKNLAVTKTSDFGVGPFVRYTKWASSTFALYGQLQGVFGQSKSTSGNVETKTNMMNIMVYPAVFINVKKNFGLNLDFGGIAFGSSKLSGGSGSTNTFNFNFGRTFNVGVSKNF